MGPESFQYRSQVLVNAHEYHSNGIIQSIEEIASFLIWTGLKIGAGALCDGPCIVAVGISQTAAD